MYAPTDKYSLNKKNLLNKGPIYLSLLQDNIFFPDCMQSEMQSIRIVLSYTVLVTGHQNTL